MGIITGELRFAQVNPGDQIFVSNLKALNNLIEFEPKLKDIVKMDYFYTVKRISWSPLIYYDHSICSKKDSKKRIHCDGCGRRYVSQFFTLEEFPEELVCSNYFNIPYIKFLYLGLACRCDEEGELHFGECWLRGKKFCSYTCEDICAICYNSSHYVWDELQLFMMLEEDLHNKTKETICKEVFGKMKPGRILEQVEKVLSQEKYWQRVKQLIWGLKGIQKARIYKEDPLIIIFKVGDISFYEKAQNVKKVLENTKLKPLFRSKLKASI